MGAAPSCLVTGGAGFCGSHLCAALLRHGASVCALDRALSPRSYLVLEKLLDQVEFIRGDVRNLDLLRQTVRDHHIDTIFHLAAQPIVPVSLLMPFETFAVNVMGTCTVLEAMRTSASAHTLVLASSGAHYGEVVGDQPIEEERSPSRASSPYGPSKTAAETVSRAYADVYGLNLVVCRFMNTYGPGDSNFGRLIPGAIWKLLRNAPFDFGDRDDGTTRLDFLHVNDVAEAYIRAAETSAPRGTAFNFGTGVPTAIADVARLISRLFDGRVREPLFRGPPRNAPRMKFLDTARARGLLGWQAEIDLEHGLAETIEWYKRFSRVIYKKYQ